MAGRSTYTPQRGERICELITEGFTLRQIQAQEGISKSTILLWLRRQPEFRQSYSQAYELWAEAMAHEILDIANDGSNDWLTRENAAGRVERVIDHEHVQRSRLRVDAIKWLMAHRSPKRWGDALRHTGPEGNDPVQVEAITDEERRRKAREAIAEKFSERFTPEPLPPPPPAPEKLDSVPREFAADGPLEADPDVARLPTRYRPPRIVGDWSS